VNNQTGGKILIIEDEADIAKMVSLRLENNDFSVLQADSGERGLDLIRERKPDLVLLDLMLPGIRGLDVLRFIRKRPETAKMPVLIVSALGEEHDVVAGLENGADDYLSKPFSMSVLVARINALMRRTRADEKQLPFYDFGTLQIDTEQHRIWTDDTEIALTKTEYRLLLALVTAKGRVLTRNQLIDKAIGSDSDVFDRTIDVHITSLRNKLGSAKDFIETVRGAGYRFNFADKQ